MRSALAILTALLLLPGARPLEGQQGPGQLDLEPEPVAFALDGASVTAAYQRGPWRYAAEVFGVEPGESLHGNEGFDASLTGLELKLERFFGDSRAGLFAGVEAGIGRREITHDASGRSGRSIEYSAGVVGGYRWYTGLGNLYLMPQAGLSFSLDPEDLTIRGDTFEARRLTPFATVGVGWSFGRVRGP